MTILLVDDDFNVTKSLLDGLNFTKLGFERAVGVNSAAEAKKAFEEEVFDVALCDIEMPGENGIELITWVRSHYPETICIFLTSHAEFEYAQKGLKLGCFDYIIQPALHSEIEEILQRAVTKIQLERRKKSLTEYGDFFKDKELEIIASIIRNLLSGQEKDLKEGFRSLSKIGYALDDTTKYCMVQLTEIVPANEEADGRLKYTLLKTCFCEIVGLPEKEVLIGWFSDKEPVFLVINQDLSNPAWREKIIRFHYAVMEQFHISYALYIGGLAGPDDLLVWRDRIREKQQDNVRQEAKIFYVDGGELNEKRELPRSILRTNSIDYNIERWRKLILNDNLRIVTREIHGYFGEVLENEEISLNSMIEFHEYFTQMVLGVMYDKNISSIDFFDQLHYSYAEFMDSYHTVKQQLAAVDKVLSGFMEIQKRENAQESEVFIAKRYILDNIMEDISVQEVADHVHFTPEYLTKIFKRETGVTLKEYIINEKFKVAKDMLKSSQMSVRMIAASLGYTNLSHFITAFRKREGMTPVEYRKKRKRNKEAARKVISQFK